MRRVTIAACGLGPESDDALEQLDLFSDPAKQRRDAEARKREKRRQQAELSIKQKFGKNAILRGMNLKEGATTISRNRQIGGHKA